MTPETPTLESIAERIEALELRVNLLEFDDDTEDVENEVDAAFADSQAFQELVSLLGTDYPESTRRERSVAAIRKLVNP